MTGIPNRSTAPADIHFMRHTPPNARFLTPGYTLAGLPRLENIYVLTALACSLLLLAACAGHGPQLGPQAPAANAAAASTSSPLELFDPHSICVTYRDDAEFRSLPPELVAPVATAHLASNPILRPRANFETVTDSIAQHFGLEIREQVYYGRVLMAGFGLPDGVDGDALLTELIDLWVGDDLPVPSPRSAAPGGPSRRMLVAVGLYLAFSLVLLGGVAPAPHGAVCGVLLPFVLAANLERADGIAAERLRQVRRWIAEAFDVTDNEALAALAVWSRENDLPGLSSMGVRPEQFAEVAAASHTSSSMKGNPVALDDATLIAVMEAAA